MTLAEGETVCYAGREATVAELYKQTAYIRFAGREKLKPVPRSLIEGPEICDDCGADAEYVVRIDAPTGTRRKGFCAEHLDTSGIYTSLEGER